MLLGVTGLSLGAAVGMGILAGMERVDQDLAIRATIVLALIAEACFWLGGGILGLSIIERRKEVLGRFFSRLAFWRRTDSV